jgi:hypothetical protein
MKSILRSAAEFIFPVSVAAVCFGLITSCSTLTDKTVSESAPAEQSNVVTLSSGWELQDISKASEPGEQISTAAYAPSKWFKATVPGTVLTSLVNDGVYPEPLYGENNRTNIIPESLCRTSYWYRTKGQRAGGFDRQTNLAEL